jgi:hypothetical protein
MAFEGEPRVIPIKGISRAGADSLCEDGAMNEVIGLEYKDGSYVPYSGNVLDKGVPSWAKGIYIHKTSTTTNVIIRFVDGLMWMTEEQFNTTEDIGDYGEWNMLYDGEVKEITFSKNIVILLDSAGVCHYYIFNGIKYNKLNVDKLRELLPSPNLYVTNDEPIEINNISRGPILSVLNRGSMSISEESIINTYRMGISKLGEIGRLHGFVLATCAYKLASGEYLYASAPVLLCPPNFAVGKSAKYEDLFDNTKYYTPISRLNENNVLTLYKWEDLKDYFDNGEYASSSSEIHVFKGEVLQKESEISGISYLPPLLGNIFLADYGGYYRRLMLFFASNALKCKVNLDIDQSLEGLVDSLCIFISEQIPLYELNEDNIDALLNKVNIILRANIIDNSDVPLDKIWFVTKVNSYKKD